MSPSSIIWYHSVGGDTVDSVAVFAVLPGNGIEIHGSTTVMGLELTVFPQ